MSLKKVDSKLADKDGTPQIGNVQDAIAAPTAAGETYVQAQATSVVTAVNAIRDALVAHGLIKAS